ncbi:hypothetical protein ACH5RR_027273 [Cinchona calisaya]|uniref:Uncharacterized protein n=1 Tax=Cinchona calisaya TaxID=153742 RepID=A0ABD2Z6U7_9GENT
MESGLSDAANSTCGCLNNSYYNDHYRQRKHCEASYRHKFSCLISSRSFRCPCQGLVHCIDIKIVISSGYKHDGRRVFLEFDSERLDMYQVVAPFLLYLVICSKDDEISC